MNIHNLWLSNIPNITSTKATALLKFFKTPEGIYKATQKQLQATNLPPGIINQVITSQKIDPNTLAQTLHKHNITFTSLYDDPTYPTNLKEIPNPPTGLYIQGKLTTIPTQNNIAIVGARKCSEYGILTAVKLAKYFATKNINVISGMAKGIDSYAHKGTLEENGTTIAVLGTGTDICYPAENRNLYQKILATGAVISEYFPGTTPMPYHFPMRNRIISGLSQGIVLVEANKNSGSLITADTALEQGRDVFAVPGNITSRLSYGTNNLIKQGATIVTHPQDVLNNLGIVETTTASHFNEEKNIKPEKNLAPDEKLVYDCISFEPTTVDEIYDKLSINLEKIHYALTLMEIKGVVSRLPGGRYTTN